MRAELVARPYRSVMPGYGPVWSMGWAREVGHVGGPVAGYWQAHFRARVHVALLFVFVGREGVLGGF